MSEDGEVDEAEAAEATDEAVGTDEPDEQNAAEEGVEGGVDEQDTDEEGVEDGAAEEAVEDGVDEEGVEDGVDEQDTAEEGVEDGAGESTTERTVEDGDFVRLSYTIRTVEDGTVVDTTETEVAEEAGIDDGDYEFEPRIVVVGAGHVFPTVESELVGKVVGHEGSVDIAAAEAFGEYDPDDVRTVTVDKIPEDDRYPGAQVTVDGEQGHLETIIGGRARVDFNHPLAGEDLEYDYEILELVDDREEQAAGLLGMYLQTVPEVRIETVVEEEEVAVEPDEDAEEPDDAEQTETGEVDREVLYIEATPGMTMNQQWLFSKQQVAQELMNRLDLDRVVIEEVIEGGAGPMGGMMGGMGGMGGEDIEEALDDADIDADELTEELDIDG